MSDATIATTLLDEAGFRATFVEPLRRVAGDESPPLDIWPYVRAVPSGELRGYQIWGEFVECVYRSGDERFDLIHVCTRTPNVFLVVVVDRIQVSIRGHHLLNLNELYGISSNPTESA